LICRTIRPSILSPLPLSIAYTLGNVPSMTSSFEITENDIERIVEFILEDRQEESIFPNDLEETIGLYLENTSGIELLEPNDISHLITRISEKVRTVLTLKGDDRKV
jgi:hypothetical protein